MMRRLLPALVLALASLLTCSPTGAAAQTIAVIPKGTTHEFWKSIHAGANRAAAELGVEVIWRGPLKEDDREAQIAEVESFVSRGVSGIVLAPLDDMALRVPVMGAARSGIPVVIIDSDLQCDAYVSFVATDNYAGGRMAGEHLAALLDSAGVVVMLRYQEGSASTSNREQGFLDAIAAHPRLRVASANQYGGATTESAYKASEHLLAPFRTAGGRLSVDGIFCPNESTTFGMLRALQDSELAGTVRFVGFDSSPKLVQALRAGELDALVLQDPVRMGYLGVRTLVQHLRGEAVPRRIDTGVHLITAANMDEPGPAQLLQPDLERWLNP